MPDREIVSESDIMEEKKQKKKMEEYSLNSLENAAQSKEMDYQHSLHKYNHFFLAILPKRVLSLHISEEFQPYP